VKKYSQTKRVRLFPFARSDLKTVEIDLKLDKHMTFLTDPYNNKTGAVYNLTSAKKGSSFTTSRNSSELRSGKRKRGTTRSAKMKKS